jgi:protein TonB
MAYLDTRPQNNRPAIIALVAVIHGLAAYAIVTGLANDFKREVMTIIDAYNVPADLPPPKPLPDPPRERKPTPQEPKVLPRDPVMDISTKVFVPPITIEDELPFGTRTIDPPTPQPTPSFVPRSARPSNDSAGWATTNDYPARDLREGNQGITGFKLIVGSSGKVESCIVTKSSGFAGLDQATCKHVPRRAKFKPATDGNGQPTAGEYTSSVRWVIPE